MDVAVSKADIDKLRSDIRLKVKAYLELFEDFNEVKAEITNIEEVLTEVFLSGMFSGVCSSGSLLSLGELETATFHHRMFHDAVLLELAEIKMKLYATDPHSVHAYQCLVESMRIVRVEE